MYALVGRDIRRFQLVSNLLIIIGCLIVGLCLGMGFGYIHFIIKEKGLKRKASKDEKLKFELEKSKKEDKDIKNARERRVREIEAGKSNYEGAIRPTVRQDLPKKSIRDELPTSPSVRRLMARISRNEQSF